MDLTYEKQRLNVLRTIAEMVADRQGRPERADKHYADMVKSLAEDEARFEGHAVLIVNRHITTLKKTMDVERFLEAHKDVHKFLVVPKRSKPLHVQVRAYGPQLELFTLNDLLVNISRHALTPKHALLSPERAEQVLAEYHATAAEMPKMYDTDPMARYIGAKAGDMVEVVRPSITSGLSTAYRVVIPDPTVS